MKKNIFVLVVLLSVMFFLVGCPGPSATKPDTNSTTEPASTDTTNSTTEPASTGTGLPVTFPTVVMPELPASVGEDHFAGKKYFQDNMILGSARRMEFDSSNKTGNDRSRYFDYSYDDNHLYLRTKFIQNEEGELLSVQEYLNEEWERYVSYTESDLENLLVDWGSYEALMAYVQECINRDAEYYSQIETYDINASESLIINPLGYRYDVYLLENAHSFLQLPTVITPQLPECVGDDIFAGQIFACGEYQLVFDVTNKTVKLTDTYLPFNTMFDYSYDAGYLYLRYKLIGFYWGAITPQEYVSNDLIYDLYNPFGNMNIQPDELCSYNEYKSNDEGYETFKAWRDHRIEVVQNQMNEYALMFSEFTKCTLGADTITGCIYERPGYDFERTFTRVE